MFYRCIHCNLDFAILSRPFSCPNCNRICREESGLPISRSSSPSPPSPYSLQPITQRSDMALFSQTGMPTLLSPQASQVRPYSPVATHFATVSQGGGSPRHSSSPPLSPTSTPILFQTSSLVQPTGLQRSRASTPELFAQCSRCQKVYRFNETRCIECDTQLSG